ncbi:MAG: hypothetical protein HF982_12665 [Desulfobacteraceae bacterium]|nr:hypothetical protein [Desulfobacteraceae bacterium]MBC2720411.1 hypothetical protein [Desulfobacteraceae bacterium]
MTGNNDTNQLNDEANPKDDEDIIDLTDVVSDTEHIDDIEFIDYTDEAISVSEEEKKVTGLDDILDNIVKSEDDLNKEIEIDHYLDDEFVDSEYLALELDVSKDLSEDNARDIFLEPEEELDELGQLITDVVEDTQQKAAYEKETASDTPEPITLSPEQVDEALERVINKMYADKIDSILTEVIEKTVTKEIERLKSLMLEDTSIDKE